MKLMFSVLVGLCLIGSFIFVDAGESNVIEYPKFKIRMEDARGGFMIADGTDCGFMSNDPCARQEIIIAQNQLILEELQKQTRLLEIIGSK